MLFPEILLNKQSVEYKFYKSKMQNRITNVFMSNTDRRTFLPEMEWTKLLITKKYLPSDLSNDDEVLKTAYKLMGKASVFTWAYTKKVYNLSNRLWSEMFMKGLPEDAVIPMELFKGFPDWCAWFSVPEDMFEFSVKGFFIRIINMKDTSHLALTIYMSKNEKIFPEEHTVLFDIDNNRSIDFTVDETLCKINNDALKVFRMIIVGFLYATLYVCQEEPDLEHCVKKSSSNTFQISEKSSGKPFISKGINSFDVDYIERENHSTDTNGNGNGTGKCPHVRSGFYRVYWTGPGRTIPKVRWVNSVFVNSDKIKD